jgi:hypothetical protein
MKFVKSRGRFEASNVCFYPESLEAYSYGWWQFLTTYKGKVLFNYYNYSPTTNRHQSKVLSELDSRDIKIHLMLRYTDKGFQEGIGASSHSDIGAEIVLKDEIVCAQKVIQDLTDLINKPKTRKTTNEKRKKRIQEIRDHIGAVEALLERE